MSTKNSEEKKEVKSNIYGEPMEDQGNFGWAVLGFFFPIVGLILFLCWMDTKKKSSKQAGIGALVGFLSGIIIVPVIVATILGTLFFTLLPQEIRNINGDTCLDLYGENYEAVLKDDEWYCRNTETNEYILLEDDIENKIKEKIIEELDVKEKSNQFGIIPIDTTMFDSTNRSKMIKSIGRFELFIVNGSNIFDKTLKNESNEVKAKNIFVYYNDNTNGENLPINYEYNTLYVYILAQDDYLYLYEISGKNTTDENINVKYISSLKVKSFNVDNDNKKIVINYEDGNSDTIYGEKIY